MCVQTCCSERPPLRRIFDLRADFAERLVLPGHLSRRQVPMRVAGDAGGIEVGILVACGAAHRRRTKTIGAARDGRLMQSARVALQRPVAGRVAVHATRRRHHLALHRVTYYDARTG
jgi:hypothetical protein